jgi:methylmalonyl-CoA/ethylmalonyl-CoA epimerase
MVHPKDAHGLLFEVCCLEMANDPRLEPDWTPAPWAEGPLGITGLRALTAAVRDLDAATAFLSDLLGAEPLAREHFAGTARTAQFLLGDTVLELQEPDGDAGPVAVYLDRWGPRMRSLDFLCRDVEGARAHLESLGLSVTAGDEPGWIAIAEADNFGVRYQFCPEA